MTMRVYVDHGHLLTEVGEYIRNASEDEVWESETGSPEGYIEVPENVIPELYIDPNDGTTRLREL